MDIEEVGGGAKTSVVGGSEVVCDEAAVMPP
jgi:hypothetical protein